MEIKKGDKFLCIKDVILFDGRGIAYKKGEIYKSERDYCITDISGDKEHTWSERDIIIQQYFKPLSEVDYVYTDATDRLRELYENYKGGRFIQPSVAKYFGLKISGKKAPRLYTDDDWRNPFTVRFYVTEDTFIGLCGLQTLALPNPQPYHNNDSLYKIAAERGWSVYLFDVVKNLECGEKKSSLRQEIEKSIDVLKIWLSEIDE